MNRKASLGYPKTVCEVVYQKRRFLLDRNEEPGCAARCSRWQRALKVAQDVYYGRRQAELHGVLHYHATYVQPDWSRREGARREDRTARVLSVKCRG